MNLRQIAWNDNAFEIVKTITSLRRDNDFPISNLQVYEKISFSWRETRDLINTFLNMTDEELSEIDERNTKKIFRTWWEDFV